MRTSALVIAVVVLGAWLSTGLALAQPASMGDAVDPVDTAPGDGVRVTLGAGAGVAPDYEGSDYYQAVPLWNLNVSNLYHPKTYVQVLGPLFRSNFIPDDHWRLGVAGQFIKKRDNVHNDRVDDLESVDASAMLGLVGGYDFLAEPQRDLVLEIEARQDVANDNGFLATIRGAYRGRLTESLGMAAYVGSTWADDDYMSSYFSIDAADAAASGLDQFSADEGFKDVSFGGAVNYRFLENWNMAFLGTYARLLNDAKDSPIVDDVGDVNQFFGGALINFQF